MQLSRQNTNHKISNKFTAFWLAAIAAGMVGVAFASEPLYKLFCEVTGYAGTTRVAANAISNDKILERVIEIKFDSNVNAKLPWRFRPVTNGVKVKIGEEVIAFYEATNLSKKPIVGTALFNVTPYTSAQYFNKIECFCFTEQVLKPGETVQMPVTFYVDPNIKNDVWENDLKTITLSYTFFMAEDQSAAIKINKSEVSLGKTAFGVPRNQIREVSSYIGDSNLKKGEKL